MTADTLKTTRVLELYQDFLSGKLINKQQAAEQYHVNVRSIQRDIDSIRDFLSEQCAKEGIVRKIEYDKKENGYRLVTQEIEQLSKGEVLALCKILLESRAFTKEQVEKQLQIILNLCVSQKEKSDIEWFISNELFHYHDPAHATVDSDNLWMVAQAIRNQSVLEIEYQKLKDRQIVKRSVEPVGLMFSEYYFYLMAVITDHSTREAFHKKNDPYPTIYRLDRIHLFGRALVIQHVVLLSFGRGTVQRLPVHPNRMSVPDGHSVCLFGGFSIAATSTTINWHNKTKCAGRKRSESTMKVRFGGLFAEKRLAETTFL